MLMRAHCAELCNVRSWEQKRYVYKYGAAAGRPRRHRQRLTCPVEATEPLLTPAQEQVSADAKAAAPGAPAFVSLGRSAPVSRSACSIIPHRPFSHEDNALPSVVELFCQRETASTAYARRTVTRRCAVRYRCDWRGSAGSAIASYRPPMCSTH
jgi:hypothetical protein